RTWAESISAMLLASRALHNARRDDTFPIKRAGLGVFARTAQLPLTSSSAPGSTISAALFRSTFCSTTAPFFPPSSIKTGLRCICGPRCHLPADGCGACEVALPCRVRDEGLGVALCVLGPVDDKVDYVQWETGSPEHICNGVVDAEA
ncbi:hypothetical protein PoMZ_12442, partial [Pyricularia oryzae]